METGMGGMIEGKTEEGGKSKELKVNVPESEKSAIQLVRQVEKTVPNGEDLEDGTWLALVTGVLQGVAASGSQPFPWPHLRSLLAAVVVERGAAFYAAVADTDDSRRGHSYSDKIATIVALLYEFDDTPFTIQRLAELLLSPRALYTSTRKWLNAVTKAVTVSSVAPGGAFPADPPKMLDGEPSPLPPDVAAARASVLAGESGGEFVVEAHIPHASSAPSPQGGASTPVEAHHENEAAVAAPEGVSG